MTVGKTKLFILLAAAAASALIAFNAQAESASTSADELAGFAQYQASIYPVMRHYCQECHTSEAIYPQGPAHSDKDPAIAYRNFKRFVKLDDPASSVIFKQLKNAHFCVEHQTNCGKEQEIRDRLEPQIKSWIQAMSSSLQANEASPGFVVPNAPEFVASFPVPAAFGGRDAGLSIELHFEQFMDREFKITRTELRGYRGTYRVRNVALRLNAQPLAQATALGLIDELATVDVFGGIQGRLASAALTNAKPLIRLTPGDRLTLTAAAELSPNPSCQNSALASALLMPLLINGYFGEGNWLGLTNSEIAKIAASDKRQALVQAVCIAAEARLNLTRPSRTTLYTTSPYRADKIHPLVTATGAVNIQAIPQDVEPIKFKDITHAHSARSNGEKCAISSEGAVYCWGPTFLDARPEKTQAARIGFPEPIRQVTMGLLHRCALSESRKVYCWGRNVAQIEYARPAQPLLTNQVSAVTILTPVELPFFSSLDGDKIKQISAGDNHTCALSESGRVFCWGMNLSGQSGLDPYSIKAAIYDQPTPQTNQRPDAQIANPPLAYLSTPLELPEKIVKIGAAGNSTCVLSEAGRVYCWGLSFIDNSSSVLRLPKDEAAALPYPYRVTDIEVTANQNSRTSLCARNEAAQYFCVGENYGLLGTESTTGRNSNFRDVQESRVKLSEPISQFATVGARSCAITVSGAMHCWGLDVGRYYSLASEKLRLERSIGSSPGQVDQARVLWSEKPKKISVGSGDVCAIDSHDELHCWGQNDNGLGVDLTLYRLMANKGFDLGFYTRVLLFKKTGGNL